MTAPTPDENFIKELREFTAAANAKLAELEAPADPKPADPAPAGPKPAPSATEQEPVVIAHAVTVILAALVTLGWAVIPNDTIMTVGSVVAFLLSSVGAVMARAKVSPLNATWWDVISGYVTDLVKAEVMRGLPKS